jgi:hypothetical protein
MSFIFILLGDCLIYSVMFVLSKLSMIQVITKKINRLIFTFINVFLISYSTQAQTCSISGDTSVCENAVENYTSVVTGVGYTYQWNAFGGVSIGSGSSISVAWANSGNGQVTLIVRNNLNQVVCSVTQNVLIYAAPKPFILPSFAASCGEKDSIKRDGNSGQGPKRDGDECLSVCDSTWVTYSTPFHAGSTYSWTIAGSATVIPSISNTIQVYWTGVGNGNVTVTETDINGCVGTNELCVVIVAKPNASFTTMPAAVSGVVNACLNQAIQFINTSNTGGGSPLWLYTWVWGDGNTTILNGSSPGNTSHAYAAAGSYTVMLIVENECHCKDTAFINVDVSTLPGPDIECVSTVCPGTTVTYSTNAICPTYNWTVINGSIIGSSTNASVTVTWGSSGPGYLTLQTLGCSSMCASPTTVVVPIITPSATISGKSLVCEYTCEKYSISCTIPVDSIVWQVPAGVTIISDSINVHEIEVCFNQASFTSGQITANYFHTTPGAVPALSCGGVATLTISKRPQLSLFYPSEICDQSTLGGSHITAASGNIQWVITQAGNPSPLATSTQAASLFYNPLWVWGPGNFTITANDLSGNYCNAPQSFNLKVNPIPSPPDSIVGPNLVCPNTPYTYLGFASSSQLTLMWNITGGTPTSSSGPFVSVLWGASGPYSLSLYQIDPATGCQSSAINYNVNSVLPLTPANIIGASSACSNSAISNAYSTNSPGTSFVWSITPTAAGSVTSGNYSPNIDVQWNNWTGTALLTLVRNVCGVSHTTFFSVNVTAPPTPTITVPASACQGATVTMSSSSPGATFTWNFGNGGTGSGSPVTHVFNSPGTYNVIVTANYSGSCTGSATAASTIVINPKPIVNISTPDPNIFCGTVGNVSMFVAAPAIATTYQWYRSPSTFLATGPSYTSNVIGTYYVVATNSFGCTGTSNTILIDTTCTRCIPDPNYLVDFAIIKQGCNKDSFSGTYTSGASSPFYNFDDPYGSPNIVFGNTATHTFPEPGYYRVRFCVNVPDTSQLDSCTICKMRVDTIKYIPNFYTSFTCLNGSGSMLLNLVNTTKILSGYPTPSYAWNINSNPVFSTSANTSIVLTTGTYNVTLTVNGVCVKTISVTVPGFPQANFTAPDSVCVNAPIPFTNTSTGFFTKSVWHFGDLSSVIANSPIKTYASAGLFNVKLVITNVYGCKDSVTKAIRVLPNTLSAVINAAGPTSFCEGSSVTLQSSVNLGYPAYSYLWNTTATTANINAQYTGKYYLDVSDSKGCFARSNFIDVLVHPKPRPNISGPNSVCFGTNPKFSVNYPATPYTINWSLDGANTPWLNQPNNTLFGLTVGPHSLVVQVTSPNNCVGVDTFNFVVNPKPNAYILPNASLCEGQSHLLVGGSFSPNIMANYWNTGSNNDSITVSAPSTYLFTVVDSNGCKNTVSKTVYPLPDFCGLLTGCYDICDTVTQLVWHAPKGYASYQWYYFNNPIPWATNDTFHVPLYQSGTYYLRLTSAQGCTKLSPAINIKFINCGSECQMNASVQIACSQVNQQGYQTYSVTMQINNNLSSGAGVSVTSTNGTISGLSPGTLPLGLNTVTFTFTDVPPVNSSTCFTITLFDENKKCDTTICVKLPPCEDKCEKSVRLKSFDCAGIDGAGNPMYQMCLDIFWGGSNGSSLSVNTPSGSVTISPVNVNNGNQTICFTYTDLPPLNNSAMFYFNFFDPQKEKICKDSLKIGYKPCKDTCKIGVYGLCVHCKEQSTTGTLYDIELTVMNTLGTNANVSILPIAAGSFGAPVPNPIPPGISNINIPFNDVGPRDSIICFRILLTAQNKSCWQDVCVYLPECDDHSNLSKIQALSYFSLAPNPANDVVMLHYSPLNTENNTIEVRDLSGKLIENHQLNSDRTQRKIMTTNWADGIYYVTLKSNGVYRGTIKLVKH